MNANADFRAYLQAELLRRCRSNPRYSLRAFAAVLATEPSFLSKLLNGKRKVTQNTIERFSARLNLKPEELARFRANAVKVPQRVLKSADPSFLPPLSPERFKVISQWHHYAILELYRLPGFVLSPRSVSAMLGISQIEAKDAITRLRKLGMLPDPKQGDSSTSPMNYTTVGGADTASAYRALQRQILEMALKALDDVPVEQRDQSSMTMAIDSALLPEARKRIRKFRRSLDKFLQSSSSLDSIYHLSVSLYPVSKPFRPMKGKSV